MCVVIGHEVLLVLFGLGTTKNLLLNLMKGCWALEEKNDQRMEEEVAKRMCILQTNREEKNCFVDVDR